MRGSQSISLASRGDKVGTDLTPLPITDRGNTMEKGQRVYIVKPGIYGYGMGYEYIKSYSCGSGDFALLGEPETNRHFVIPQAWLADNPPSTPILCPDCGRETPPAQITLSGCCFACELAREEQAFDRMVKAALANLSNF